MNGSCDIYPIQIQIQISEQRIFHIAIPLDSRDSHCG